MRARYGWLFAGALGLVAALVLVARAQDDQKNASAPVKEALEAGNPDNVDPNDIKGETWTLDFKYADPEAIVVVSPTGKREVYWYIVYTVTNNTGEDRMFIPSFTLLSNTFKVVKAGIYPNTYSAIRKNRKIRFLENTAQLYGKLRVGPDNAKTGVAVFKDVDPKTDAFSVFVGALSGEFVERPRPGAPENAPPDEKVVRLYKALELKYNLPGDEWWTNLDKPVFVSKDWTWR